MLRVSNLSGFNVLQRKLLLDAFGQTAKAAYGLRKLRSAYSGAGVRVRRASDSVEQDIGFSGESLDWSAASSFEGASDIFVTTWYEQSGNASNLVQATAANQPQLDVANKRILFDGSNDRLSSSSTIDLSGTDKVSISAVMAFNGNPGSFWIGYEHNNDFANRISLYKTSTGAAVMEMNQSNSNSESWSESASTIFHLYTTVLDRSQTGANDLEAWSNKVAGTEVNAAEQSSNFANGTLFVGSRDNSSLFLNGSYKELVVYPIALNSNERLNSESNTNNYYTIF